MESIGSPLLESIRECEQGNYEQAVSLLYPVRYNITRLGGSDAQVSLSSVIQKKKCVTSVLVVDAKVVNMELSGSCVCVF